MKDGQEAAPAAWEAPGVHQQTAPAGGSDVAAAHVPDALDRRPATPWSRWCARVFDMWWQTMLAGYAAGYVLGQTSSTFLRWLEMPGAAKLFGIACVPVALLLDAVVQAVAGNTPGKALLGLRVCLVDGRRLTLVEQLRRNLGVWSAGLGFGIPLVNLFTMLRQQRLLKEQHQASYDDVGFRVMAKPIGWGRRALFGVAFVALFAAVAGFDAYDKESDRKMADRLAQPAFAWTNPDTGTSIEVAPQWHYARLPGDGGAAVHQFTQYSEHAVVIMTSEDINGMTLNDYVRAWTRSMATDWRVAGGYFEDFRGHPSWVATGRQQSGGLRIQVRVLVVAGVVWRVTAIQSPPMEYTDALVDRLSGQLWDTVAVP